MFQTNIFIMVPARGPQAKLRGNHDRQAIGSWARYRGLGTQADADDEQSQNPGYWQLAWVPSLRYPGNEHS